MSQITSNPLMAHGHRYRAGNSKKQTLGDEQARHQKKQHFLQRQPSDTTTRGSVEDRKTIFLI